MKIIAIGDTHGRNQWKGIVASNEDADKTNYYTKSHTINVWVKVITNKFNDLEVNNREINIAKILGITSNAEIKKIKEASLIVFGKSLGVETFEDACIKLGLTNKLPTFIGLDSQMTNKFIAEYQLIIIIKALNEGWYPNWEDINQYKYSSYFNTSCGFSYWLTFYDNTITYVPSALYVKSNDLAMYCAQKFYSLYEDYFK